VRPVVVFTANDRPHYMRRVLDSWEQVRGIGDALLIFQCEPHLPTVELVSAVTFAEIVVNVNGRQMGVEANPYLAMRAGFATGADFVIQGEEDTMVTADLLEYMAWARDEYEADKNVLAVCTLQNKLLGPPDQVFRRAWFSSSTWGTWRDRWDDIRDDWPAGPRDGGSWDWYMTYRCVRDRRKVTIEPCTTRAQHIGEIGVHGEHSAHLRAEWERQRFTADIPPQAYREVPRATG
jgi:hypothetical protein